MLPRAPARRPRQRRVAPPAPRDGGAALWRLATAAVVIACASIHAPQRLQLQLPSSAAPSTTAATSLSPSWLLPAAHAQSDDPAAVETEESDGPVITQEGCTCVGDCGQLFLTSYNWCYTEDPTPGAPPPLVPNCGRNWGVAKNWWDYCNNPENITGGPVTYLDTAVDMWYHITVVTCMGSALAYFVAGCMACRVIKTKTTYLWLPLVFTMVGSLFAFAVSSASSYMIAAVYLSIPYSIDRDVAIGLGLAQAALLTYAHLGRGYHMFHAGPRKPGVD